MVGKGSRHRGLSIHGLHHVMESPLMSPLPEVKNESSVDKAKGDKDANPIERDPYNWRFETRWHSNRAE